ncbi:MAG: thioesterase family protein [Bacteroidales bacterium]|jgi:predicted thioesterase|nr:thioesterase family protein [Bacteroidales bacterium]
MEINIKEGIENQLSKIVKDADSAATHGSGLLPVFATPAMVAFMEQTAHCSVGDFLPEGCTTVGIEINVKHIKATPLGMSVNCQSKLTKVDGKRLYFDIKAYDEVGQIGEATHVRYIVDSQKFMDKLK